MVSVVTRALNEASPTQGWGDATARFTITQSRHLAALDALEEKKTHLNVDRERHC